MPASKITLKEAQAIAYLLEHGRLPDPDTGTFMEERTSEVALEDSLLAARLRGSMSAADEGR